MRGTFPIAEIRLCLGEMAKSSLLLLLLVFAVVLASAQVTPPSFPLNQKAMASICNTYNSYNGWPGASINVYSANDFTKRLNYSSDTYVYMVLQNNIAGPVNLTVAGYSNMTILSPCGSEMYTIYSANQSRLAIYLTGVSNVILVGINLYVQPDYSLKGSNITCSTISTCYTCSVSTSYCPASLVENTHNVSFVGMNINGTTIVTQGYGFVMDGVSITIVNNHTDIAVNIIGVGDNVNLIPSGTIIKNSNISNSLIGVRVAFGSCGVTITNNNITQIYWAAFQVDVNVHNVASAVLVNITNNYVHRPTGFVISPDSAALYTDTHWGTTLNYVTNNYFLLDGQSYCFYLDYDSSYFQIDGLICDSPGGPQYKLNTGRYNHIDNSVLLTDSHNGWINCENSDKNNNCYNSTSLGTYWVNTMNTLYNTPAWHAANPDVFGICNQTSVNGIPCVLNRTEAQASANCSGLPIGNHLRLAYVGNFATTYSKGGLPVNASVASNPNYTASICYYPTPANSGGNIMSHPMVDALNLINLTFISQPNQSYYRVADGTPRIIPGSPLDLMNPNLKNFPWNNLGPQTPNYVTYLPGTPPALMTNNGGYASLGSQAGNWQSISGGKSRSFTAWIYVQTVPQPQGSYLSILSWSTSCGSQEGMFFVQSSVAGVVDQIGFTSCNNFRYQVGIPNILGAWHHVALTYNGTELIIYLDGVSVFTSTNQITLNSVYTGVGLGIRVENGQSTGDLIISSLNVYSAVLTQQQVGQDEAGGIYIPNLVQSVIPTITFAQLVGGATISNDTPHP